MNSELYKKISESNALRIHRDANKDYVLSDTSLFEPLLKWCFDTSDENHHKACWTLELVLEEQLNLIEPYLDFYTQNLKFVQNESALHSLAKIGVFIAKSKSIKLNDFQTEQLIEINFDWLINEQHKVATKAYAMQTLFELGKTNQWVNPELKRIISEDYVKNSAAYKATARHILKKL